jgi:hypothetical protein
MPSKNKTTYHCAANQSASPDLIVVYELNNAAHGLQCDIDLWKLQPRFTDCRKPRRRATEKVCWYLNVGSIGLERRI